jgi:hypothetical protein
LGIGPAVGRPGGDFDAGGPRLGLQRWGGQGGAAPGPCRHTGKSGNRSTGSGERHDGIRRHLEVARHRGHHAPGRGPDYGYFCSLWKPRLGRYPADADRPSKTAGHTQNSGRHAGGQAGGTSRSSNATAVYTKRRSSASRRSTSPELRWTRLAPSCRPCRLRFARKVCNCTITA